MWAGIMGENTEVVNGHSDQMAHWCGHYSAHPNPLSLTRAALLVGIPIEIIVQVFIPC